MLFDSPQARSLLTATDGLYPRLMSRATRIARASEFTAERGYLESAFAQFPEGSRRRLLGAFFNSSESQHVGAWFEIMLAGWLNDNLDAEIQIEPTIDGKTPDFAVQIGDLTIVIEARAMTIQPDERAQTKREAMLSTTLQEIEIPAVIGYEVERLARDVDVNHLKEAITDWLTKDGSPDFCYVYGQDIEIAFELLEARTRYSRLNHIGGYPAVTVLPDPVRKRLKSKTRRYRAISDNYPYVIALFLEPTHFTASDVVDAWFGADTVWFDSVTRAAVRFGRDGKGLHYHNGRVLHRSVSGTLVFTRPGKIGYPHITAHYIQNPYANNPIAVDTFPASGHWVITEQGTDQFKRSRNYSGPKPREDGIAYE